VRIALVIEQFAPQGGVEGAAWQLAHGLAAAGDEVSVVARRAEPSPAVALRPVRVSAAWQPARVLAFSRAAARAAPRGAFDLVHSFSRTRHQDVYSADGGSHAEYMDRQYAGFGRLARRVSPRHAVLLGIERGIFADPTQTVLCPSRFVADSMTRRHGVPAARLAVIPYGVDLERFHPGRRPEARAALRAELGAGDAPVWLLVGAGWRRKGLDVALRALAGAQAPDARLWVAGGDAVGPWRGLATSLGVGERVRFLGRRSDVERLYAAADALLLPTRYDAFGAVCLEAAATGIPVVTSAAAGAAEVLGDGGLVVPDAEDAAGFAAALDALADADARGARGEAARKAAEAHSMAARVAAVRALYARLVVGRRGSAA
jgi:UDP-glucose:(heptosyl)LPS alpha-1,3-glucosyltransferase